MTKHLKVKHGLRILVREGDKIGTGTQRNNTTKKGRGRLERPFWKINENNKVEVKNWGRERDLKGSRRRRRECASPTSNGIDGQRVEKEERDERSCLYSSFSAPCGRA